MADSQGDDWIFHASYHHSDTEQPTHLCEAARPPLDATPRRIISWPPPNDRESRLYGPILEIPGHSVPFFSLIA